jgi:maleamate amidohydrolase
MAQTKPRTAPSGEPEDARAIYRAQNIGHSSGFGARPALLIVDFVNGFNDPALFGGGNIAPAIARTRPLLHAARAADLPIIFTRVVYAADGSDACAFTLKMPGLVMLTEDAAASQVVPELAPQPGEHVISKTQPSAFFGTGLADWLKERGVDTVLIAGCTTSGCVRASAVDSMSHNFRTLVVGDCVGDRAIGPHDANLFDMEQKYADLITADDAMVRLQALQSAQGVKAR